LTRAIVQVCWVRLFESFVFFFLAFFFLFGRSLRVEYESCFLAFRRVGSRVPFWGRL
jgi:hypothetical protein